MTVRLALHCLLRIRSANFPVQIVFIKDDDKVRWENYPGPGQVGADTVYVTYAWFMLHYPKTFAYWRMSKDLLGLDSPLAYRDVID